MNKELEALSDLRNGGLVKDDVVCFNKKAFDKRLDIIETALKNERQNAFLREEEIVRTIDRRNAKKFKILEYLKDICLEGKDKYGNGSWGWVEFDLDKHPILKNWLKDEK